MWLWLVVVLVVVVLVLVLVLVELKLRGATPETRCDAADPVIDADADTVADADVDVDAGVRGDAPAGAALSAVGRVWSSPAMYRCTGTSRRHGYTLRNWPLVTRGTWAMRAAGTVEVARVLK